MMRPHPPTARQIEIMRVVARLTAELGHPPNATNLAAALGITHRGARKALAALQALGLLADVPIEVSSGKWRVTREGQRWIGS